METFSKCSINAVLRNFPKFELSYEIITHKKVLNPSVILAIPKGNKCFAWFTKYNNENVCFLLEIENEYITNVQIINTSFTNKLSLGTIFYGTSFSIKNVHCYCVEDLYYYAGKYCGNYTFLAKLEQMKATFQHDISQSALSNNFTIFGLPLMTTDLRVLVKDAELLPYKVDQIKFRFFGDDNAKKIVTMSYFKPGSQNQKVTPIKEFIFKITPDIEPDIYKLHVYNKGIEEYYGTAFIPDYKTSVLMNKLFRNIKENDNLDAIEESDDEAEFENSCENKYVYLNRSFKMKCEYNNKFKKWTPISLANNNEQIVPLSSLNAYR